MRAAALLLLTTLAFAAVARAAVPKLISFPDKNDRNKPRTCDSFPEAAKGLENEKGEPLFFSYPRRTLVREIRDGMYYITEGSIQGMFLVGNNGVIVVDAPIPFIANVSLTHVGAIKRVTDLPVTHVVLSHFDQGHTLGAKAIVDEWPDAEVVASPLTKRNIRKAKQANPNDIRLLPTVTFSELATISLDGELLTDDDASAALKDVKSEDFEGLVMTIGDFHQGGDLIIYSPSRKVLMAVDIINPGWLPYESLDDTIDVQAYTKAHDHFLDFDFETFVAGHVNRLGTRKDVEVQREYIADLHKAVRNAVAKTGSGSSSQSDDPCDMYDVYATRPEFEESLGKYCADEMREKWAKRLGAFETFIVSHCLKVHVGIIDR